MAGADQTSAPLLIDASLVRRLVAGQFPHWAQLPVRPVEHEGWDNRTFHLGDHMAVRLPSAAGYAAQVEKEQQWLPRLAPHLPLPIPTALAMGEPGEGYPWRWSIREWIEGEAASRGRISGQRRFAASLGEFLSALQAIDASEGPKAGAHNHFRGGPLHVYDGQARAALAALDGDIDRAAAEAVWSKGLESMWRGSPVWVHGDVSAGNLLVRNGELSAVIDFGLVAVGDPACDLTIAWTLFDPDSRRAFRRTLNLDEDTWARGRSWTLWKALIVCAGLARTNAADVLDTRRVIDLVLEDHRAP